MGRKTANVVRSVAFGLPGLPVDTHVGRLSRRLGLTTETDPVRVEHELNALVPAAERGAFSLRLILHGRSGLHGPVAPLRDVPAGRRLPVGRAAGPRAGPIRASPRLGARSADTVGNQVVRSGCTRFGTCDR